MFLNLTLTEELARCTDFANFSEEDLLQAQYYAVDAAFCDAETKSRLRAALDAFSKNV